MYIVVQAISTCSSSLIAETVHPFTVTPYTHPTLGKDIVLSVSMSWTSLHTHFNGIIKYFTLFISENGLSHIE